MENKVSLLGIYGTDQRVCLSAWQSTTEELGIELPENIDDRVEAIFEHLVKTKKKSPEDLLKMLATEGHHTPFEKIILDFQVTADIASHIHILKHRISSVNSESARYKEFQQDKFYIPTDWNIRMSDKFQDFIMDNKKGEWIIQNRNWNNKLEEHILDSFDLYHQAIEDLTPKLGRKRAKESARYFLTYATQLNFDFMINFRSFVNFQRLRNSTHAQKEIRELADMMLNCIKNDPEQKLKYTLQAFGF